MRVKDDTGGVTNAEEERDGEKNDGFTRFVARLLFPLLDSRVSEGATRRVDKAGITEVG